MKERRIMKCCGNFTDEGHTEHCLNHRVNVIGQNGNDGLHYIEAIQAQIPVGSLWQHKNGKEYIVLFHLNDKPGMKDDDEYPFMIGYVETEEFNAFLTGNAPRYYYAKRPHAFIRNRKRMF